MRYSFRAISGATSAIVLLAGVIALNPAFAADLPAVTKASPPEPSRFWVEFDYLAWTVKGDNLPALVTTSPAGTPLAQAGVLGAPGTSVLFGNSTVNDGWRSGMRAQIGYWIDPQRRIGLEGSFFGLEQASTGFGASSNGSPILARPFFDALLNQQSSSLIAFPGLVAGSVNVNETSKLLGVDALYRQQIGTWGGQRLSMLLGYRYLHSADKLGISSSSTVIGGGGIPIGTVVNVSDSFNATSDFHGLDLGILGEFTQGPWSLEWRARVALGANFNDAEINGSTTVNGVATASPGGLLALSSNIGSFSQTRFAVVPAFALKGGYQFAPGWRLIAGYELLYWTDVQRAGNLIDTTINTNLVPPSAGGAGPQRPQVQFSSSPLLAQGFSVGLRFDY